MYRVLLGACRTAAASPAPISLGETRNLYAAALALAPAGKKGGAKDAKNAPKVE